MNKPSLHKKHQKGQNFNKTQLPLHQNELIANTPKAEIYKKTPIKLNFL